MLTAAAVGAVLCLARPALVGMGNYNLVVFFVLLSGGCVLSGVPIAFASGTGTAIP